MRDAAHTFTTEAIAMIFGRFSANGTWMKDMKLVSDEESKKIAEDSI